MSINAQRIAIMHATLHPRIPFVLRDIISRYAQLTNIDRILHVLSCAKDNEFVVRMHAIGFVDKSSIDAHIHGLENARIIIGWSTPPSEASIFAISYHKNIHDRWGRIEVRGYFELTDLLPSKPRFIQCIPSDWHEWAVAYRNSMAVAMQLA